MKNIFKTTIGVIAITFASISVSQADSNRHRDYDRSDRVQNQRSEQFNRYKKHYQMHRQHKGNHLFNHTPRPHWKHAQWKRHYWKLERKRAIKQMQRERAVRRAVRQDYRAGYGRTHYVAPPHHVTYVGHSNNAVPVIAGGLIGSSIANNVSHGDPAATVGGAIFGAIIGNAIAHH